MTEPKTIDFSLLALKPDQKYILFVDPSAVDLESLANTRIDADVVMIPVNVPSGKTVADCVHLSPRGGTAEEFIEDFVAQENKNHGL